MNRNSLTLWTLTAFGTLALVANPRGANQAVATRPILVHETVESASPQQSKTDLAKRCADSSPSPFKTELLEMIALSFSDGSQNGITRCTTDFSIPENRKSSTALLLAFVPDPVHTNLALFFDRQIEAIEQGAADDEWTFERALTPWDNKDHPESTDYGIRLRQKSYVNREEEEPGLLMFRSSTPGALPDRLLVFLIGENPTAGIHKKQFANAAILIKQLYGENIPLRLPIFGPTFSGSLASLRQLFECPTTGSFPCDHLGHTEVYSGTISSQQSATDFKNSIGNKIAFATLQEYDEIAIRRFLNFALSHHYCANHIAILSEDETAYGEAPGGGGTTKPEECNSAYEDLIWLMFPREISQFRNAYQRNLKSTTSSADNLPGAGLPLDLETTGNDDDTVAQYSQKQTPLSQESVLLGVATELRKHHIDIVLVRATDPLDRLFLSQYLRSEYPQGRIITLGADLLFRRQESSKLHGVMALTTYSLIPGAGHEVANQIQADRVFPSAESVGSYNAVKILLAPQGKTVPLYEYRKPKLAADEKCLKSVLGHPSIHLTVLGNDGFWDIAIPCPVKDEISGLPQLTELVDEGNEAASKLSWPQRIRAYFKKLRELLAPFSVTHEGSSMPLAWRIFFLLSMAATLGYLILIWSASMLSASETVAHLAPPRNDSRVVVFALTGYLHFALTTTVLWPYGYYRPGRAVQLMSIVGMWLVAIVCAADLRRRGRPVLAMTFLLVCVATLAILYKMHAPGYTMLMFVRRSVHLTSGVSPLLPFVLLLAGSLWGAWHSLSGSALVDDDRRPRLPAAPEWEDFQSQPLQDFVRANGSILEGKQQRLLNLLRPDYFDLRSMAASVLIISAVAVLSDFRPLLSLEDVAYEYLLALVVAVTAGLLLYSAVRLQVMWTELRRLLLALYASPLRNSFVRLKGFSWSPVWQLGSANLGELRRLFAREQEALNSVFLHNVPGFDHLQSQVLVAQHRVQAKYDEAFEEYVRLDLPPDAVSIERPNEKLWKQLGHKLGRQFRRINARNILENELIDRYARLQRLLAKAGLYAFAFAFEKWKERDIKDEIEEDRASQSEARRGNDDLNAPVAPFVQVELVDGKPDDEEQAQVAACERFVALLYTTFILVVLVRIRSLIIALSGMYVLLLFAVSVYPFQPQAAIRLSLMLLLAFIVAVVGSTYAQMHRDATLSYITDTKPGELGLDFWIRITSFAAIPLFSLIASQFPSVGGALYPWFEPALRALK